MDHSDENTGAVADDDLPSVCVSRRRAQSCSGRQTLPSPTTSSVRRSVIGSPGPPRRAASSRRRRGVVRRLSPAAVEAARLAIAARQAYARRESSRSMGETALFIVTNDAGGGQQTLDEQDVALLLQGNRSLCNIKTCYSAQLALVKNRTSHGSLGSRQTAHACDTSLETAIKISDGDTIPNTILQQTEKLSAF